MVSCNRLRFYLKILAKTVIILVVLRILVATRQHVTQDEEKEDSPQTYKSKSERRLELINSLFSMDLGPGDDAKNTKAFHETTERGSTVVGFDQVPGFKISRESKLLHMKSNEGSNNNYEYNENNTRKTIVETLPAPTRSKPDVKNGRGLTKEDLARLEKIHNERRQRFKLACQRILFRDYRKDVPRASADTLGNKTIWETSWFKQKRLFHEAYQVTHINDEHRLMYCSIPKAASTAFKSVFLMLSGAIEQSELKNISLYDIYGKYFYRINYLDRYRTDDKRYVLNHYRKFIFVRNPFERLLSAFRSKLVGHLEFDKYMIKYRQLILERYQKEATPEQLESGDGLTFKSFIKFLMDSLDIHRVDRHWRSMMSRCGVCYADYDFIGHYETLADDVKYLFHLTNLSSQIDLPFINPTMQGTTGVTLKTFYSQLPKHYLHQIYNLYKVDFDLFGYDYPYALKEILRVT